MITTVATIGERILGMRINKQHAKSKPKILETQRLCRPLSPLGDEVKDTVAKRYGSLMD